MRKMMLLTFVAVSLAASWAASSPAMAHQYEYCLQGRQWGYPGNCQFSSYRQCMAAASGTNSYCDINPAFASAYQRRYRY